MKRNLFWLLPLLLATSCVSNPVAFEYSLPDLVAELTQGQASPALRFLSTDYGVDFIETAELQGSRRDLGRLIGEVSKHTVIRPRRIANDARDLNLQIIEMYRSLYPAYLEELAGIAEVNNMTLEDLDLRFMEREFFVQLGWLGFGCQTAANEAFSFVGDHCSTLAATLADGSVMLGRNFDYDQASGVLVRSAMDGDLESVGMSFICVSQWIMDGVNDRGLSVSVMTVGDPARNSYAALPYPDEPAVDCHHLMRIILDTCSTYEEARALAASVRVWFGDETVHFMVADASGAMGVFEFEADGSLSVAAPEAGEAFMLSTNNWLSSVPLEDRFSCFRYGAARYRIEHLDVLDAAGLRGVVQCMSVIPDNPMLGWYPPEYFEMGQTVWTSFYDLSARTMNVRFWLDPQADRWFAFSPAGVEPLASHISW